MGSGTGVSNNPKLNSYVFSGPPVPPRPPPAPDLTDDAVKAARRNQLALLMAARGRRSTFLTGPLGDASAPQLSRPSILGGV